MEKKTILYDEHCARGAKMTSYGGYQMPLQYEGIIAEHRAVREKAGVFDISHMGEFLLKGEGAGSFLDQLLTNPVGSLAAGRVRYSPMCYEDGGTVDDLLVYALEGAYMLVVNAANRVKDAAWIQEHLPKEDVVFVDISEQTAALAVQGPQSQVVMKALFASLPQRSFRFDYAEYEGERLLISRTGYTGEHGYEIYGAPEAVLSVWGALMEQGVAACGLGARDTLRLEAGLPLYGNELTADIRPDEAGLGFAIKTERDSFIGQAALRIPAEREHVRLRVQGRGIARPGQTVFAGTEPIGVITSGTQSPTLGYGIAMALVVKKRTDAPWRVVARGRELPVTQVEGGFLDTSE